MDLFTIDFWIIMLYNKLTGKQNVCSGDMEDENDGYEKCN